MVEWFSDYRRAIGWSAILSGLIVVVIGFSQGDVVFPSILVAVLVMAGVLLTWWTRPSGGGHHVDHAVAQAAAGDEDLIVYWRPG